MSEWVQSNPHQEKVRDTEKASRPSEQPDPRADRMNLLEELSSTLEAAYGAPRMLACNRVEVVGTYTWSIR